MRKIQVIVIILSILFITQNALSDNYDFRKTRWGMSQKEVIKSENIKPECINCTGDGSEFLGYRVTVLNKAVLLGYTFVHGKLVMASYALNEKHTNKNDYIEDYKDFKEALIKKYGRPKIDNVDWRNDLYKDSPSDWGLAVSLGQLEYISYWETDSKTIKASLRGDNYEISCWVFYESKKLAHLKEKYEKKKTLDNL